MPKAQTQAKDAMPKHLPRRPVGVRLLHTVNAYLRKKQRGKGDMSKLIYEALTRIDLSSVPLITIHGRREPTVAKVTQIVMPNEIRRLIEHWSENRRCSMNELLNSALVANLPKTRSEHDSRSVPSTRATDLGQMTTATREAFFAKLLSLRETIQLQVHGHGRAAITSTTQKRVER